MLIPAARCPAAGGEDPQQWSGKTIMETAARRHEAYPYVYEEQTIVLMDANQHRDVRKARRFSRIEADGTVRFLLIFGSPEEIRGVALLANRTPDAVVLSGIFFPATGRWIEQNSSTWGAGSFLGTDFSVEDLTPENMDDFVYVRKPDKKLDRADYFVVEALPRGPAVEKRTGYSLRRHLVRKDNFFIVRTDYYDRRGRYFKSQTRHDLVRVQGEMWRADMVLMENRKDDHMTLIKVDRRVFSHDFVPTEIFSVDWIKDRRNLLRADRRLFQKDHETPSFGIGMRKREEKPVTIEDLPMGPRTGIPGNYSIPIPHPLPREKGGDIIQ